MPTADDFRRIFAYNEKVLQSFFEALGRLPWETFSKNMEASHNSMKNIFIHILAVYNGWINYNAFGRSDSIPWEQHDPENYHSMSQVGEFMSDAMKGVRRFMDELNDSNLSRKITAPWMEGGHELSDVLMQVTLEQAHHLGEIIALLWQLNVEPPQMTWIDNT
jgi:uncharacterized damage-inducible protein DinB